MRRLGFPLLAAGAAIVLLAGCGEKRETVTPASRDAQSFTLMLDWFPNADHVGIYEALANGAFTAAGLNVHVEVPSDPALPLELVAAGKVDAAISYEPEVLLARNQDQPLVSVAALVQEPLTAIVSIGKKHITTPAQLRGKRVGDAGIPYQHAYLETILAHAGVPADSVQEINVGANLLPAMLSGRVDATLGAFWNYEAIELANDSDFGLQASVWTRNVERGEQLARQVQAGVVCVNDAQTNYVALNLPMGGWKASGLGTRHGANGIRKYCNVQSLLVTRMAPKREVFMFPYGRRRTILLRKLYSLLYGRGARG